MSIVRRAHSSRPSLSAFGSLPIASSLGLLLERCTAAASISSLSAALIASFIASSIGPLIAPSSALASEAQAASEPKSEVAWELAAQQDGIDVYTRPVNGSGIKEFKAVAEVNASVPTITALLRDADLFKTWFPNTPESKLLKREGDVSYQYSVMATPWPISDRDNVLRSVTKVDREAGTVHISVSAAPDEHPEQTDRVRVRKANGSWVLEAVNESKTRVLFQMHLEPGGGIPQWMINARVVETPLEAITNMRQAVKAN